MLDDSAARWARYVDAGTGGEGTHIAFAEGLRHRVDECRQQPANSGRNEADGPPIRLLPLRADTQAIVARQNCEEREMESDARTGLG